MIETIQQHREKGVTIFGLLPFNGEVCGCGDPNCKAAGKHPSVNNWTATPVWSDEQFEVAQMMGEYDTGYAVLLDGLFVVDIDPRNGGERIEELEKECGYIVETGGGGWHYYFKAPNGVPISKTHDDYKGVDFLSGRSHFVVGAGSNHKSGTHYKIGKGSIKDITDAPNWIIDKVKNDGIRTQSDGLDIDVSVEQLREMLTFIMCFEDYPDWITIGMALEHTTNGDEVGKDLWKVWSQQSDKFNASEIDKKWASFGETENPVTYATLHHFATEGGWIEPVTFDDSDMVFDEDVPPPTVDVVNGLPFATDDIDLLKPTGFVGQLTDWIDNQCLYPRRKLAVASALMSVADIGGLNHILDDGMTKANLIFFCIAGSSTGKEAVLQARDEILSCGGLDKCHNGAIKSEQEVVRNIIKHQLSTYTIDEIGFLLQKVSSATKQGGAIYLQGLLGIVMSLYSKATGKFRVSGDLRDTMKATIRAEIKQLEKLFENGEIDDPKHSIEKLNDALSSVDGGIDRPFLSLMGFTTPRVYDGMINHEMLTNGFLARSMIVDEVETNPKARKRFKKQSMPMSMKGTLMNLFDEGNYDSQQHRVEMSNDKERTIPSTEEALDYIDQLLEWQWQKAEEEKLKSGYESIWRRSVEMVNKVSLTLALPSKLRTGDHVRWAAKFVFENCETKINLGNSVVADKGKVTANNVVSKILTLLDYEDFQKEGFIVNRCRKFKKDDVLTILKQMTKKGEIDCEETTNPTNHRTVKQYRKNR